MKLSIVTPSYNCKEYISETIESVLSQKGSFELEYIVVDGISTDGSLEIINSYKEKVDKKEFPFECKGLEMKVICEEDNGMYDAINKGFSMATGQIFAWINADDLYLPGAFDHVSNVFGKYKKIKWLKGITSYIDKESRITRIGVPFLYYRKWIKEGIYGRKLFFIQQNSCYWRRELWKKVGGLNPDLKLAGDFDLWVSFAKLTPLYSLNAHLDCFRFRPNQLSENKEEYYKECDAIVKLPGGIIKRIDRYAKLRSLVPPFLRATLYWYVFGCQRFYLVDIMKNGVKPAYTLRKFKRYEFWGTRY